MTACLPVPPPAPPPCLQTLLIDRIDRMNDMARRHTTGHYIRAYVPLDIANPAPLGVWSWHCCLVAAAPRPTAGQAHRICCRSFCHPPCRLHGLCPGHLPLHDLAGWARRVCNPGARERSLCRRRWHSLSPSHLPLAWFLSVASACLYSLCSSWPSPWASSLAASPWWGSSWPSFELKRQRRGRLGGLLLQRGWGPTSAACSIDNWCRHLPAPFPSCRWLWQCWRSSGATPWGPPHLAREFVFWGAFEWRAALLPGGSATWLNVQPTAHVATPSH